MSRLVCLMLLAGAVQAGEVQHANVKYSKGIYDLTLDIVVDADRDAVYGIVTDYEHLDRISDVLVETALIATPGGDDIRRRLVAQTCILFFCFKINMIEDVEEIGEEVVITTMVAELSDFKYGKTEWRVTALEDGRTRIQYRCRKEPAFWVPPLIGPLLMKHKMLKEAKDTVERIEYIANHG